MTISHLLEDFSVPDKAELPLKLLSEDGIEDIRLASFEQGYTAGWDDAIRAQAKDQSRVTGELANSLEDFSFTYQEALKQMIGAVEPVFQTLLETVLPEAMMQTVGMQIVDECCEMARGQVDEPLLLLVPSGASPALKPAVQGNLPMSVEIVENDDLGPGQIRLKIGRKEREIDADHLMSKLHESVDAFFYSLTEETRRG